MGFQDQLQIICMIAPDVMRASSYHIMVALNHIVVAYVADMLTNGQDKDVKVTLVVTKPYPP